MGENKGLVVGNKIYQSTFNGVAGVYRATYGGVPVVVKSRQDPMTREVNVLRKLDDPRFPKVIDHRPIDDTYRLILEEKPGVTLAEYIGADAEIKSRPLSDGESTAIIGELALALIALRDTGFYYRDMNMKHILVDVTDDGPAVALIDHEVDVSIAADGTAQVETRTGTWETMAPEEFAVGGMMTEATSTYALGAILYQLTHGEAAFRVAVDPPEGMTSRDLSQRMHETALPDARLTRMVPLLRRALDPDPSGRYTTIEDFLNSLHQEAGVAR